MTKTQVAYLMSFFPFRLALGLVGILIGLLIARWLWGRFASRWNDAVCEIGTLRKDVADQVAKNSQLRNELDGKLGLSSTDTTTTKSDSFQWDSVDGVDSRTAQALEAYGLRDQAHLNSLSATERAELSEYLEVYGLKLDPSWSREESSKAHRVTGESASAQPVDKHQTSRNPSVSGIANDSNRTEAGDSSNSGIVSSSLTGSSSSTSSSNPTTPGVQRAAGIGEGVGFVADKEDWDHENKKMTPLSDIGKGSGAGASAAETAQSDQDSLKQNSSSSPAPVGGSKELGSHEPASHSDQIGHSNPVSPLSSSSQVGHSGQFGQSTQSASSVPTPQSLGLRLPKASGPDTNWAELKDMDPSLEAELGSLGVRNLDQLASLSLDDRRKLERHLSIKGIKWDWKTLEQWRSDQESDANSTSRRGDGAGSGATGSVGSVGGSGSTGATASDSKDRSGSTSSMNPVVGFAGFAAGRSSDTKSDSQANQQSGFTPAKSGAMNLPANQSAMTGGSNDPNALPVLFSEVPEFRDDLTLLDGIDGPQSIELRRMGIYNFSQLHNLSAEDRARLQSWFRKRGWHLDMDQWRIASEGNTLNPSIEDIQQTAFEVYQHRVYHDNCGGERTDWEQAEWKLRGNPSFGWGVPHDVDDFAVSMTGISVEARDELYRMGLYNKHQIDALDNDARRLLTRWFAGPRFGVDLTQAFGWLSSLKEVPHHLDFGTVYAEKPYDWDDLSLINGVGPATELDLNRIGIYHFKQIIEWSPENIASVSEALQLDDRVISDYWIEQAKRLSD